jgi:hypothetical protein
MELDDDTRTTLAKTALLDAADLICAPDSKLSAVLIMTDGVGLSAIPVRLTKREAFTILVAACSALEPEDLANPTGEIH